MLFGEMVNLNCRAFERLGWVSWLQVLGISTFMGRMEKRNE